METLSESLVLDLQPFAIRVNVLIFQGCQSIDITEETFFELASFGGIGEDSSRTGLGFAGLVSWI